MKVSRIFIAAALALAIMSLVACGGNMSPTPSPSPQSKPLDPQGNWLFNFTSNAPFKNGQNTISVAGQLFELNPPVVSSNPLGEIGAILCGGSFTFNGQASGTDTINLTGQQVNTNNAPVTMSLTGTIAADQAHMNGTWNVTQAGDCMSTSNSGTWAAQLLAPVTGNWSGTLSNSTIDLTLTAVLTENTDQTSTNMGQVTGTATLLGSPCFPSSDALNISPWNATTSPGVHGGETLIIATDPDANGVRIEIGGTVMPDGTSVTPAAFTIHGGACDGQTFTGSLSH